MAKKKSSWVSSRIPYVPSSAPKQRRSGGSRREREYWAEIERQAQQSQSGSGSNATVDGQNAVVETDNDEVNIYYGGQGGDPLGPGHGHIVTSTEGETTYVREPGTNGSRSDPRTNDRQRQ